MKYQSLFIVKNKKNISKSCLLKILPGVLSIEGFSFFICKLAHAYQQVNHLQLLS